MVKDHIIEELEKKDPSHITPDILEHEMEMKLNEIH